MTLSVAARRYARALFALEKESGPDALERCGAELQALAALARESTELARLFRNPVFSAAEKQAVLGVLADRLSLGAAVRDFCGLLADKGRLDALPGIAAWYGTLLDAEKGVRRAELRTAVPLDESARERARAHLEKKAGSALALEFTVDPAILGGMVLKIGDVVLDASLMAQLSLLKDTIMRGTEGHAD